MAVTMGILLALTVVTLGHHAYGTIKSSKHLVAQIAPDLTPSTRIYSVRYYDQTFPFYLNRPVILVEYQDEFSFGQRQEPGVSIPTLDEFIDRWNSGEQAVAMMTDDTYRNLLAKGLDMKIIYQDPRRLVVRNR